MISEIKRTYDPGAIYLVNKDITRFHRSDNPINGKTLHTGTPVVYIQTIQQTDSCIVRDYTGQLWRLSRDDLDHQPASEIPAKGEILLYKLPFFLAPFSFLGGVVLFFLGFSVVAFVCFGASFVSLFTIKNVLETAMYHLYTNPENLRELEVLLEAQKADVGKEIKNDK